MLSEGCFEGCYAIGHRLKTPQAAPCEAESDESSLTFTETAKSSIVIECLYKLINDLTVFLVFLTS